MVTMVQRLVAIYEAIFVGGKSMLNEWSIQTMIKQFPIEALKAKIITGWPDGKGGTYNTSIADHMVYFTQYFTRIEAKQAAQGELLNQIVNALSKGVDLQIDYDRIDASIKAAMPEAPEYDLVKKESK